MEKQLGRFGTLKKILILRNCNIEDWLRSGQYNNSTLNETRDSSIKIEQESPHIGTVFAQYQEMEGAILARNTLKGLKYDGKAVETGFYDEAKFDNNCFF